MKSALLAALLAVTTSAESFGAAHVPADFPTIQEAIDSGADQVFVSEGVYPERLTIQHPVELLPDPASGIGAGVLPFPKVNGITFTSGGIVRGFHSSGPIVGTIRENCGVGGRVVVEGCRADSGIAISMQCFQTSTCVRNCIVRGDVNAGGMIVEVTANTVLGGSIGTAPDGEALIRDNVVVGPATIGIRASGGSADAPVRVLDNLVRDVHDGIVVTRSRELRGNVVQDCSGTGITLHRGGIPARGNVVVGAGGDGIVAVMQAADSNVVGRCGGTGIVAPYGSYNTSYLNAGDGFKITWGGVPVTHNIAFRNSGDGLRWVGGDPPPLLECNDWFGNAGGATSGSPPGSSDLSVDPLFCNVDADSVGLRSGSPLLDSPGCGLIGALGLGCTDGTTETLEPRGPTELNGSPPRIVLFPPYPSPAAGSTSVAFILAHDADVELEVSDVQGRTVATLARERLTAGSHERRWSPGLGVRAGVYFVRMQVEGQSFVQRLSVLR